MLGGRKKMVKNIEKLDECLLDKRVAQRNIVKKLLTEEEYKSYLSHLKDESSQCESVQLKDEDTF